jgi:hypothetical protein
MPRKCHKPEQIVAKLRQANDFTGTSRWRTPSERSGWEVICHRRAGTDADCLVQGARQSAATASARKSSTGPPVARVPTMSRLSLRLV